MLLVIHSVLRWVLLAVAVACLVQFYRGWLGKREYHPVDRRLAYAFAHGMALQTLLGMFLYMTSLATGQTSPGGVQTNSITLFFGLIHPLVGFLATAVALGALNRSKTSDQPQRTLALGFTLALVLVLVAIPWPFTPVSRPWISLRW